MLKTISESRIFDGTQHVLEHLSQVCGCDMRFGVFLPPGEGPFPTLFFLAGLTCTEQNFITKAGAQRVASELGLAIVTPDTSPRGDHVADEPDAWDLGQGAGFYVNATQPPWDSNYQMAKYVADELFKLVVSEFPLDPKRVGISGHSMGGHGALTLHLRNPNRFKSVSAFAPIVAPLQVPWGRKAFGNYLGDDADLWRRYDACSLVTTRPSHAHILIDQGKDDQFLDEQLRPHLFQKACDETGQTLTLRQHPGYDHSYYFIATLIDDHLRHHAKALG